MKKLCVTTVISALLIFLLFVVPGCLKDTCRNTYKIFTPVYKKLTEVRAGIKSSAATPLKNTGKIYVYDKYIFLNEVNKGIHVIDNSNPSAPRNFSFINIPGNVDIAVRGNYLYADCYSDIVVLDISNPTNVQPVKFLDNALPGNGWFWANNTSPNDVQVITEYIERDTTVDCTTWSLWGNCANCAFMDAGGRQTFASMASAAPTKSGQGGSMARFTIAADYLYGVTTTNLNVFSLNNAAQPQKLANIAMGWGIETIYPFKDKLFIGSMSGMFIYNISNPSSPVQQGMFAHARVCDPVIADDNYAFVTLRSNTNSMCQGFTNQLDVVDITNLSSPKLLKSFPFTNPHGLSKDGNLLFICDGTDGLKVLNASNPSNISLIKTFSGLVAYDIIAMNGNAIVIAQDGLYQYNYSNAATIQQVSKLSIEN